MKKLIIFLIFITSTTNLISQIPLDTKTEGFTVFYYSTNKTETDKNNNYYYWEDTEKIDVTIDTISIETEVYKENWKDFYNNDFNVANRKPSKSDLTMALSMHEDKYSSDALPFSGPKPKIDPTTNKTADRFSGYHMRVNKKFPGYCPAFGYLENKYVVTPSFGRKKTHMLLFDANDPSQIKVSSFKLPGREIRLSDVLARKKRLKQFKDTSGGAYFINENNKVYVPLINKNDKINGSKHNYSEIWILEKDNSSPNVEWSEKAIVIRLNDALLAENYDKINTILFDLEGNLWFTKSNGYACVIPKATIDKIHAHKGSGKEYKDHFFSYNLNGENGKDFVAFDYEEAYNTYGSSKFGEHIKKIDSLTSTEAISKRKYRKEYKEINQQQSQRRAVKYFPKNTDDEKQQKIIQAKNKINIDKLLIYKEDINEQSSSKNYLLFSKLEDEWIYSNVRRKTKRTAKSDCASFDLKKKKIRFRNKKGKKGSVLLGENGLYEKETFQNSFSTDATGVYMVTNLALYKFSFSNDQIVLAWDTTDWKLGTPSLGEMFIENLKKTYIDKGLKYNNCLLTRSGQLNNGTGTTPTLVDRNKDGDKVEQLEQGEHYVVICDNDYPNINSVAYDRLTGEIQFAQPLFSSRGSACENSPLAIEHKNVDYRLEKEILNRFEKVESGESDFVLFGKDSTQLELKDSTITINGDPIGNERILADKIWPDELFIVSINSAEFIDPALPMNNTPGGIAKYNLYPLKIAEQDKLDALKHIYIKGKFKSNLANYNLKHLDSTLDYSYKVGNWSSNFDAKTATPKVTPNGIVYVYNREPNVREADGFANWHFTALDPIYGMPLYTLTPVYCDFKEGSKHRHNTNKYYPAKNGKPFLLWAYMQKGKLRKQKRQLVKQQVFNNLWGTFTQTPDGSFIIGTLRGFMIVPNIPES